jgi:predicted P-loop ATPase
MVDAFGVDRSEYTTAVMRYLMSAMVGRQYDPGCQVDMVPILTGEQGMRKTTMVAALAPVLMGRITHGEMSLTELIDRDQAARSVRGKAIITLDELRGMSRQREQIKAAVTRRVEEHAPKYVEYFVVYLRRCVMIGTTNEQEFLDDPTGARRMLPLKVVRQLDVEWLVDNLCQVWAEAAVLYREKGVLWQDAERLARNVHGDYSLYDSAQVLVEQYLQGIDGFATTNDILTFAMGIDATKSDRRDQMRLAAIMNNLGYEKYRHMIDGIQHRGYRRKSE